MRKFLILNFQFLILASALALTLSSCTRHSEGWARMEAADALMEERPDSALEILAAIDTDSLRPGHETARHALLLSMALDRNVIELDSFTYLQPAIDYYADHGTPDERLRTLYYTGRIHTNRGENDLALQCFIQGKDLKNDITDSLTYGRLLVAEGVIYYEAYFPARMVTPTAEAAHIFHACGRTRSELNSWLKVLNYGLVNSNKSFCDSILNFIYPILDNYPEFKPSFSSSYLIYTRIFESPQRLHQVLDSLSNDTAENVLKLDIASGYLALGEPQRALSELHEFASAGIDPQDSLKYLAIKTEALDSAGYSARALDSYRRFFNLSSVRENNQLDKDYFFAQEHHDSEMARTAEAQKVRHLSWIIALCVLILVLGAAVAYYALRLAKTRRRLLEAQLNLNISILEEERSELSQIINRQKTELDEAAQRERALIDASQNQKHPEIAPELIALINERLRLLDRIMAAKITKDSAYLNKIQELIDDKKKFMEHSRKTIEKLYPQFIKELRDHNLTDRELDLVCLFALGLNTKEVGTYTSSTRHYHHSSEIRKKLNMDESKTNLPLYIQRLFKKYESTIL